MIHAELQIAVWCQQLCGLQWFGIFVFHKCVQHLCMKSAREILETSSHSVRILCWHQYLFVGFFFLVVDKSFFVELNAALKTTTGYQLFPTTLLFFLIRDRSSAALEWMNCWGVLQRGQQQESEESSSLGESKTLRWNEELERFKLLLHEGSVGEWSQ